MGVLHLVNRSPGESLALSQCLERAGQGDAVLLLESGVYAVLKDATFALLLRPLLGKVAVYALEADLIARGIGQQELIEGVVLVDYAGFVQLSLAHGPIQSWF